MLIGSHQLLCHGLGLGQTGFLGGHVDVIVDMAVAGGKMPFATRRNRLLLLVGSFTMLIITATLLFIKSPDFRFRAENKQRGGMF